MESGSTSSCHRTEYYTIDPDNFDQFHNLPAKVLARENMLKGTWPGHGCEYCKNVEVNGGVSDRVMTLNRLHGVDKIPPELLSNSTATEVTPTTLEIYFNNTCNLSCVYCTPTQSSKWSDEINRFGPITIADVKIQSPRNPAPGYQQRVEDLWKYLEVNDRYKIIRHFHLLGGESLLQRELDMSIDFWRQHPNPSLTFNIITNLMLPHEQFKQKISKFKKLVDREAIFQLEVTASLDCWGPEQEYVRSGLNLELWQQNFEYLLDKTWIKLAIHSCINSLTIKTMPELITKINVWNQLRTTAIDHSFDLVIGRANADIGLHPTAFGDMFDQDLDNILSLMHDSTARSQMQGIAKFIKNAEQNKEKIVNLISYLNELDRRRNTNWRQVFPWLIQFEQHQ
jgi:pyruvate-formate lyase-activating enzyme